MRKTSKITKRLGTNNGNITADIKSIAKTTAIRFS